MPAEEAQSAVHLAREKEQRRELAGKEFYGRLSQPENPNNSFPQMAGLETIANTSKFFTPPVQASAIKTVIEKSKPKKECQNQAHTSHFDSNGANTQLPNKQAATVFFDPKGRVPLKNPKLIIAQDRRFTKACADETRETGVIYKTCSLEPISFEELAFLGFKESQCVSQGQDKEGRYLMSIRELPSSVMNPSAPFGVSADF